MVVVAEDAAPIESKVAVARIIGKRDAIVISWNVEGRNRARDAKWADPVTRAPHDMSERSEYEPIDEWRNYGPPSQTCSSVRYLAL
jgi:hypothetical protein